MLGVYSILDASRRSEEDYYKMLNCDETATVDQINTEFKLLAFECHPDKNSDPTALIRFQILQEARQILTDRKLRQDYDKWRRSEVTMSFKQWQAMGTRCQTTMHWAKPRTQVMIEAMPNETLGELNESTDDFVAEQVCRKTKAELGWYAQPRSDIYRQFRNYRI